jgi:O-antigen/teichoic acid export membrane protein
MEPLLIRYSTRPSPDWRRGTAAAAGTTLAMAGLTAIGLICAAAALGGTVGTAMIGLAITMPGLLLQDAWRLAFFAGGRGRDAFLNDVAWGICLVPAFLFAGFIGPTVFTITVAWGLAASLAALIGMVQARVVPRPAWTARWWREHSDLAARFLAEAGLRTGLAQLAMILIGVIAGLEAIGSIRAAQLVMSPIQVLFLGASLAAVPEAVRALARSLGLLLRIAAAVSIGLAVASLTWGLVALLLPDELGRLFLGDSWAAAQAYLPAWIVAQIGTVMTLGPGMTLRAFANARLSLKVTAVTATIVVVVPTIAAFEGGLPAAWGLAGASVAGAALWWLALPSGIRTWRQAGTTRSAEAS